jgi:hypothetical protein
MNIYRLDRMIDQYGSLELNTNVLMEAFGRYGFVGLGQSTVSIADRWPICEGDFFDMHSTSMQETEETPDVYIWLKCFLALSPKAKELLEPILSSSGEFLPFSHNKQCYYLFSTFSAVEADPELSEMLVEKGATVGVKSLVFPPASIGGQKLFKTKFDRFGNLYCTESFMNSLLNSGLTLGVTFSEDLSFKRGA